MSLFRIVERRRDPSRPGLRARSSTRAGDPDSAHDRAPDSVASYRHLLRTPGMAPLFGAIGSMSFGGGLVQLTLILYTLQTWGSSRLVGAVVLVSWVPGIALSPIAGMILDRSRRAPLVALDSFVVGAAMLVIVLLARTSQLEPWSLLTLVGLASVTLPFGDTGLRTLLAVVPGPQLWDRTNAFESALASVASTVAPIVAGVLVGVGRGELGLTVGGSFMLIAGIALFGVREPVPDGAEVRDLRAGFLRLRTSWRDPSVRVVTSIVLLDDIAIGILQVALPVWMFERFGVTGFVIGLVWAAFNLASFGVTLTLGAAGTGGRESRVMAIGFAVQAAGFALLTLGVEPWWVVGCMALAGATIGSIDVSMFSLLQRSIEPSRLAGANALALAVTSLGVPAGAALGGLVVAWRPDTALLVAPLIALAAATWAFVLPVDGPVSRP